jgi:hypothetical protein
MRRQQYAVRRESVGSFYVRVRQRRAVSESAFDGTLICDINLEKLRSEDLLSKRVMAIRTEKLTISGMIRQCTLVLLANATKGILGH